MRFVLSEPLLIELRAWRASRPVDEIEERHDAFCLDPRLGPAWYLTSDGRVLRDGTNWPHPGVVIDLEQLDREQQDRSSWLRKAMERAATPDAEDWEVVREELRLLDRTLGGAG